MKNKVLIKLITLSTAIVLLTSLTSCAREISSKVYDSYTIGESSKTFPGVIVHTRDVHVSNTERLELNALGITTGGAGGAIIGSQFGNGIGQNVTTIIGATAGAVGGALAEKSLTGQNGIEYIVQLDIGDIRTIVQGPDPLLSVGQNVYVIESTKGRSRVVSK